MIRKIVKIAAVVLVAVVLAAAALLWYARPVQPLDLSYGNISLAQKGIEMIKARKPELHISEKELNDLLKKQLAERAQLSPDVVVEGARFEQRGNRITAYVNLKAAGLIAAGLSADFTVEWKPPKLIVSPAEARIRSLKVPASWLPIEPMELNLAEALPSLVGIQEIRFEERDIVVAFKLNGLLP